MSTPDRLARLTDGLLYISESEYGWDIIEVPVPELPQRLSDHYGPQQWEVFDARAWLQDVASRFDPADPGSGDMAGRYQQLLDYLEAHCNTLEGLQGGDTQRHICIICHCPDGWVRVLHTVSVET